MGQRVNVERTAPDLKDNTYTVTASSLIPAPDITGKTIFQTRLSSSFFLPLPEMSTEHEVTGGRTHGVAAGRVQHGSWSTEQTEELGAPPLLGWQVPAWVDHLQRQQC